MTGGSNGMNCRVCGAGLRAEAMFCGECGSAARHPGWMDASLDRSLPRARNGATGRADVPERASVTERAGAGQGRQSSAGGSAGSAAAADAGAAAAADAGGERVGEHASERVGGMPPSQYETTVRLGSDRPAASQRVPVAEPVLELRPEPEPEPVPGLGAELWHPAERESESEPEPTWLREPDSERPNPDASSEGLEDRRATVPTPTPAPGAASPGAESPDGSPRQSGESTGALTVTGPRAAVCGSVVARFSTGEVVTLHGTGLIGRNPIPQEGERFDVLVRINDPARSVSKTHLEFVVDAGRLWIRDRYSGNGTILRHPNGTGSRCEGGRRYRVGEGDRVEIGEQHFDVR